VKRSYQPGGQGRRAGWFPKKENLEVIGQKQAIGQREHPLHCYREIMSAHTLSSLPPGWSFELRQRQGLTRAYNVFHGPDGHIAKSVPEAWRKHRGESEAVFRESSLAPAPESAGAFGRALCPTVPWRYEPPDSTFCQRAFADECAKAAAKAAAAAAAAPSAAAADAAAALAANVARAAKEVAADTAASAEDAAAAAKAETAAAAEAAAKAAKAAAAHPTEEAAGEDAEAPVRHQASFWSAEEICSSSTSPLIYRCCSTSHSSTAAAPLHTHLPLQHCFSTHLPLQHYHITGALPTRKVAPSQPPVPRSVPRSDLVPHAQGPRRRMPPCWSSPTSE